MIKTTILKPVDKSAHTAKTYALDINKKPELIGVYDTAKLTFFQYAQVSFSGVKGLYNLLDKCKNQNFIRIAGEPRKDLKNKKKGIRRNNDNFLDSGTRLLFFDADDWEIPPGFSISSKEDIRKLVEHLFIVELGFKFLKDRNFVVLLSSSQWSHRKLRAHVYFLLDKALYLKDLREWALAHKHISSTHKLDPSVFRQVQPDYISKRICQGFPDPIPDNLRLTVHCDHLHEYVSRADLAKHMSSDIQEAGIYRPVTNTLVETPIGETWGESLELCGTAQHGINDPAYRGCAQLVQEVGDKQVEENIAFYTDKVFTLVWQSIAKHGVRGNHKDRSYYNRERFRGYILSALKKRFGKETDEKVRDVARIVQGIKEGKSSINTLFDSVALDNIRYIKNKLPGKWAILRSVIKTELRGKVSIADVEKATTNRESKLPVAEIINQLINSFEWVEGTLDQCLYCKSKVTGDGYSLLSIDSGVDSDIYAKALELFDDNTPFNIEKNVMKVIHARSRDEIASPFVRAPVENRCYSKLEDNKQVLYYNLGRDPSGGMQTAVVDEMGVRIINSTDAPVTWSTERTILHAPLSDPSTNSVSYYLKKYIRGMNNFSSVEDSESLVDMLAWQVIATVNTGTASILEICGASKDGKSTTALFVKELVDPTSGDLKDGPDLHQGLYKKPDMAKTVRGRHVTIFDNIDNLKQDEQDLLCTIATGWKYDLRVMYTQQYLNLVIKRPIIMTCLSPVITNQDLRTRSISINVTAKNKSNVVDIYQAWEREKMDMRTGMLYLISRVIKYVNKERAKGVDLNDRDMWGIAARVAILRLLGEKDTDDRIKARIQDNKSRRDIEEALLNSRTSTMMVWFCYCLCFAKDHVSYTAGELHLLFRKFVSENVGSIYTINGVKIMVEPKHIPNTARGLSILIGKHVHDIETAAGINVSRGRTRHNRVWKFLRVGKGLA